MSVNYSRIHDASWSAVVAVKDGIVVQIKENGFSDLMIAGESF